VPELTNEKQIGGDHYKGAAFQHWDWVAANGLGYFEGQITKYLCRWQAKNGLEDLRKSLHYTEKLIELLQHGVLPFPKPRVVKQLPAMTALYGLTEAETEIFRLTAEYATWPAVIRIREYLIWIIRKEQG
jgi:hypothetical protein